eukprot:3495087-Pyramimonas_sp.AAC.1
MVHPLQRRPCFHASVSQNRVPALQRWPRSRAPVLLNRAPAATLVSFPSVPPSVSPMPRLAMRGCFVHLCAMACCALLCFVM